MKSSKQVADPCMLWLLAYPEPSLVRGCTATENSLRDLFRDRMMQHSGQRKNEGYFRVDLSQHSREFTLYVDSTLQKDTNEFCQIFYFDAEYWKGEYSTPGWKEHFTESLASDLTGFQDVLLAFAPDFWNNSWLRYTVGNANGCRNAASAQILLRNVCASLGREPTTIRETHKGILVRLAPVKQHPSLFVGNCYIPRQIDLLFLQYTESYDESNRWLLRFITVLRYIATYEVALWLVAQDAGHSGTPNPHLLELCLRHVREKAGQLPRLYEEWGESFDASLVSFLGRGIIEDLWGKV